MLNGIDGGSLLQIGSEGVAALQQSAADRRKIDALAADPLASDANVKRLQGRPDYRLRVQDGRVIFRVEGDVLWIDDIGSRGSVY